MWQRRAGGNPVTILYETTDCKRAYNENCDTFGRKWRKMLSIVSKIRQATTQFLDSQQRQIISFRPEHPVCCQVKTVLRGYTAAELCAARDEVQKRTNVRVFEYLWPNITPDEKLALERAPRSKEIEQPPDEREHEVEWMIMDVTEQLDDQVFVDGYTMLCEVLREIAV